MLLVVNSKGCTAMQTALTIRSSDSKINHQLCISPLPTAAWACSSLTQSTAVQDALNEIARQRPRDLLKPLRVHFIGEDGIDAGGVKKEFFQLLVTELLCPDYGMLIFQPVRSVFSLSQSAVPSSHDHALHQSTG